MQHQIKGDLDWIVIKCLKKDRVRRYDTASGLAAEGAKRKVNMTGDPAFAPALAWSGLPLSPRAMIGGLRGTS